jgi:hypothetical protein
LTTIHHYPFLRIVHHYPFLRIVDHYSPLSIPTYCSPLSIPTHCSLLTALYSLSVIPNYLNAHLYNTLSRTLHCQRGRLLKYKRNGLIMLLLRSSQLLTFYQRCSHIGFLLTCPIPMFVLFLQYITFKSVAPPFYQLYPSVQYSCHIGHFNFLLSNPPPASLPTLISP